MYIIDRFEGSWAVIETDNKQMFNLPRELIFNAKEGDVINITVNVDQAATSKRREKASKLLDNFFDE